MLPGRDRTARGACRPNPERFRSAALAQAQSPVAFVDLARKIARLAQTQLTVTEMSRHDLPSRQSGAIALSEVKERPRWGGQVVIAGTGFQLVDKFAVLYLALPVAIFFAQWFNPWFGLPLAAAAVAGLGYLWPIRAAGGSAAFPGRTLAAAAVAAIWTLLSGAGHFFFANYFDWHIRDAVLRDLAVIPIPPVYRIENGVATILRAPVAYYVLPGLMGRLAGVKYAEGFLYLWTFAGTLLFLLQVMAGERRWRSLGLIAATVVLFSGMDILGDPETLLDITSHKEWWAGLYQYSSDSTLLFWAPNHALPGWLSIALIYRCRDDPRFLAIAAWLGALTLLWAPLVSIGLLPFFAALAYRSFRRGGWLNLFSICNLVAAPLVGAGAALYVTIGAGTIAAPGVGMIPSVPLLPQALIYFAFILIEFAILCYLLVRDSKNGIEPLFFGVAVAVLIVLPLFKYGPNNDLVMRSSIPALAAVMFAVVDGWARPARLLKPNALLTIVLLIGAVTPVSEIARALLWPNWEPRLDRSVYDATGGASTNYLAELKPGSLAAMVLRQPEPPATP